MHMHLHLHLLNYMCASSLVCVQAGLAERLHWERVVLEQAQHYQVVPLMLINLKGCPNTTHTQQLVEGIKVCGWAAGTS
jgi:hypothetical protein